MAVRKDDPKFDKFQWWNPFDWLGFHDEESIFKSSADNKAIRALETEMDLERERERNQPARRAGRQRERAVRRYEREAGRFRDRESERQARLDDAYNRFVLEQRGYIDENRDFWTQMRDRSLSAFKESRRDVSSLRDIRDQQIGLANELRDAPSTVEEQARMEADRALQSEVAMAGAFGGSLASNFASFSNKALNRRGDVLRDTGALRAQEFADRINQRSNILGRAGATSGALSELGRGDAQFLSNLGAQNVGIGRSLMDREAGILGGLQGILGFGRAGDLSGLDAEGNVANLWGGLGAQQQGFLESEYNRLLSERSWDEAQQAKIDKRRSGIFKGVGKILGGVGGAIFGGPAGGAVGGKAGESAFGGIGDMFGFGAPASNEQFTSAGGYTFGRPNYMNTYHGNRWHEGLVTPQADKMQIFSRSQ